MATYKNNILSILTAGVWVNASEFFRNEVLVKSYWVDHFQQLNLVFPSAPVNGIVWILWGFVFSGFVLILSRRYNLLYTTLLSWLAGFCLMWLVIWNLQVLPTGILWFAVPLSLLECFVAALICKKLTVKREGNTERSSIAT